MDPWVWIVDYGPHRSMGWWGLSQGTPAVRVWRFPPWDSQIPLGRLFWSLARLPALWGWFSAFSMHVF